MIPNQWYAIAQSKNVTRRAPLGVIRFGEELVLWRDGAGKAVCMEDRCAHRGIALSLGRCVDGQLACGYHGFRYESDGRVVSMPCMGPDAKIPASLKVPTKIVQEANGYVWMWWGDERDTYPPLPWFDELPTDARWGRTREEIWPFNYARLCENHLDAHHWAFVHDSVMVGVGEFFDNFEVKIEEDGELIKTGGTLRRGAKGNPRLRGGWDWKTYFRFPNLSMIQVTSNFRSLVIQTPMDEETSWVSIRSFQTYTRIQPFRWMLDLYCMTFLAAVPLHLQDFPLFHAQKPRFTGVGVNKLVGADAGIAKYLMTRQRLIKRAEDERAAARAAAPALTPRKAWVGTSSGTAATVAVEPAPPQLDRATGAATLPMSAPERPRVRVPAHLRNARVGIEPIGRPARWAVACMTFPLLVPSLFGSWMIARFHRP